MSQHGWAVQLLPVGILWMFLTCSTVTHQQNPANRNDDLQKCLVGGKTVWVVADNFYGIINASKYQKNDPADCMIFLQDDISKHKKFWKTWPQVEKNGSFLRFYIPKYLAHKNVTVHALAGNKSGEIINKTVNIQDLCDIHVKYDKNSCKATQYEDKYILSVTNGGSASCINCDNPIKTADETLHLPDLDFPVTPNGSEQVDAADAAKLMNKMGNLVSSMNGTSASLSLGKAVEGLLVKQPNPADRHQVSIAYMSPSDMLNIIEDAETLSTFSRSVTVPKEAFEKAISPNVTVPFAAMLRFLNMTQDENNSTVLGNEVLAIEMGAQIKNLTDTIQINFKKLSYKGNVPRCHSWGGVGSKPNWTSDGCETYESDDGIICKCSHLTFFAILLSPINETISSADLKNLTIITQVGCGLSVFFLGVVLFMHFLLRKKKASQATIILIHLVLALFLLNFTFLFNNPVAKTKSFVGCQVMAFFMHYFMLATLSWFAAQAFHICLHLYNGGLILIRHYIIAVSATTWLFPAVVAIVLAILGKYGEQTIYADNPKDNVDMCWINDNNVHYIVNIGYYALVFLFTFSTVIISLSWIFCLTRTKTSNAGQSNNGKSIVTTLGLCCQLGISWGFAFFAYGGLRIPSAYIFTILNSFQGFFLFIYYYNTSHSGQKNVNDEPQSSGTGNCGLETIANPYMNTPHPKQT